MHFPLKYKAFHFASNFIKQFFLQFFVIIRGVLPIFRLIFYIRLYKDIRRSWHYFTDHLKVQFTQVSDRLQINRYIYIYYYFRMFYFKLNKDLFKNTCVQLGYSFGPFITQYETVRNNNLFRTVSSLKILKYKCETVNPICC